MITPELRKQLEAVALRHRQRRLWRERTLLWMAGIVLAIGLLVWRPPFAVLIFLGALAAGWALIALRHRRRDADYRWVAQQVETKHPELQTLLLAALDQRPDPETGNFGFLQMRVIADATAQSHGNRWFDTVPEKQLSRLRIANTLGMALVAILGIALVSSLMISRGGGTAGVKATRNLSVEVTPGDVELERGSPLTVLVRFPKTIPGEVSLRIGERTVSLKRNLNDPVFGGAIAAIEADTTYRVEFNGNKTRDYTVKVFDYPKLERADALLKYPAYTKLPEKKIENTRAISAIENTRLDLSMRTNKPVASARLVDKEGNAVPLAVDPQDNRLYAAAMTLEKSGRYQIELVDEAGRKSKHADEFDIKVFPNKPPEIKVRFPVADSRATPLEEMRFEADVSDDFGLSATGLTYAVAGKAPQTFHIPQTSAAQTKQHIAQTLKLEDEGVKPNDLITWYLWAEDLGPDGGARRTQSEVHFATVRHFEEIFHPGQSAGGPSQPSQGNPGQKLIEVQKQIIQATWNVQRQEKGPQPSGDFSKNTPVLKKSQEVAIEMAKAAVEMMPQPEAKAILAEAQKHMALAVTQLGEAGTRNSLEPLPPALEAENAAYRALLKLGGREWRVVQSREGQPSESSSSPQQQKLQDLEMKRNADRYETERQASAEMTQVQKDQLQVLSRLRELAQRQQDLNEKLKELQIALQTAKTPEERAEIERELKRLREKQQEMLADIDQLNQRMNDPSQSAQQTAEAKQQLENTREAARKAADELEKKNPGNALAAGSRAEKELEKLRDDFRKQTSGEFSEQMRAMRTEARDLAQKEEELGEKLANAQPAPKAEEKRTLRNAPENKPLTDEINRQGERLAKLLENMREVTEASETSEPVLSRKLLDAVRKTDHAEVRDALALAAEKAGQNAQDARAEAAEAEGRARKGVADLKQDVEAAAESVLGNEMDALRFAKAELDELTKQIEKEIAAGQAGQKPAGGSQKGQQNSPPGKPGQGQNGQGRPQQPGQNGQGEGQAQSPSGSGGQPQPGEGQQGAQPGQPSQSESRTAQQSGTGRQRGSQQSGPTSGAEGGGSRDGNGGLEGAGVFTGGEFANWSDRLRNVEEIVDQPGLRDALVKAREAARDMRAEVKRHAKTPQWDLVRTQIAAPLEQAEARIAEELARRGSKDPLAPVERDPVPEKYAEIVRKYYEQLGK